jgi:O-antigen/teichoic acid export membrane protein
MPCSFCVAPAATVLLAADLAVGLVQTLQTLHGMVQVQNRYTTIARQFVLLRLVVAAVLATAATAATAAAAAAVPSQMLNLCCNSTYLGKAEHNA